LLLIFSLHGNDAGVQVIELKFGNCFLPPARRSQLCEDFPAELEQRTAGKVKSRFFPGYSLLKAPAMFSGVVCGIAEIGVSRVEYTPGRMPAAEGVGLPPSGIPAAGSPLAGD
jgi:TRAP-type transport system periplasmic protein